MNKKKVRNQAVSAVAQALAEHKQLTKLAKRVGMSPAQLLAKMEKIASTFGL